MGAEHKQAVGTERGPRVRATVYGLVTLMAVLVVLSEHPPSAWRGVGTLLGTTLALVLADVYAESIAETLARRRRLTRAEVRTVWRDTALMLTVAQAPTAVLVLAALGVGSVERALTIAQVLGLLVLFGYGSWVGRTLHADWRRALVSGVLLFAIGGLIVALKVLAH